MDAERKIERAVNRPAGDGEPSVPEPHAGGSAHGRVVSWCFVVSMIAAFVVGGLAIISGTWWLFWVAAAVVFVGVPVGKVIGIMNDTVAWTLPLDRHYQPQGHIVLGGTPERDAGRLDRS